MRMEFMDNFTEVHDIVGDLVSEIKKQNEHVVIFGAGYCVTMVMELCEFEEITVRYILDNDVEKHHKKIKGVEIISYEECAKKLQSFCVLIATKYFDEITDELRMKGFNGEVFHLPINGY